MPDTDADLATDAASLAPLPPISTRPATSASSRTRTFLRIPSISGIPAHAADCRRAADWLVDALTAAGLEHVEALETGGHPVVYADWLHAPGRADGARLRPLRRPAGRPARAVDVAAVRAGRRRRPDARSRRGRRQGPGPRPRDGRGGDPRDRAARFPVNVKYVFEGEEESSSVHLDAWLEANRDRLAADVAIISDTGFFEGNVPAITRQPARDHVRPDRRRRDARSTSTRAATAAPSRTRPTRWPTIIASLKGPDGRIRIPGFYDDVVAAVRGRPGGARRAAVRRGRVPARSSACRRSSARSATRRSSGAATRPTLDVNGLWGGFQGEGSKTIIPAHAHAKVSCRLVAAQDPDRIFEALPGLRRGDRPARRDDDRHATSAAAGRA